MRYSFFRNVIGTGVILFLMSFTAFSADPVNGESAYNRRCAACHDNPSERIPSKTSLQGMSAARILRVMDFGAMMPIAYPMTRPEREAVAAYLGKGGPEPGPSAAAFCSNRSVKVDDKSKFVWNGWSPAPDNTRFMPREVSGLSIGQVSKLKLRWAFGFEGDISAMSQPAVIGNQIFVGSASGMIYSLRADTGCIQWTYQSLGPVRAAIKVTSLAKGKHALLYGDLIGWFYALEAESGKLLWKKKVEEHEATRLTAGPAVNDGVVYVTTASWEETRSQNLAYECCTFRGSVVALRVRDGSLVWKTYMIPDIPKQTGKAKSGAAMFGPSGAGIWGTPTIDVKRKRIYVATGDNYSAPATPLSDAIIALDMQTGKVVWSHQTLPNDFYNSGCRVNELDCGPDYDFGASVMLTKRSDGRDVLIAGQKSAIVYALDPDKNGERIWEQRVGKGGTLGGIQWGMSTDGHHVYAAVSDVVYAGARGLDPNAGGGITALRIDDGSKVWHVAATPCAKQQKNCSPAQSAALTSITGVVFSGSVDGHLRAYSSEEGKILWDVDTARDYQTVNGVKGNGGSLDGPGPVIVNGMLFVNSGYSRYGGMWGNVLLAFGTE